MGTKKGYCVYFARLWVTVFLVWGNSNLTDERYSETVGRQFGFSHLFANGKLKNAPFLHLTVLNYYKCNNYTNRKNNTIFNYNSYLFN